MKDFITLVLEASDILDVVENYQFEVGRLANEVVETYGYIALEDFAKQIEETSGVWRSPSTLRMYAFIYRQSVKLGLPKDILFSTCQKIVFSDNPVKYARLAKGGLNRTEILKAIENAKN